VGGIERNIKRDRLAYRIERINGKSPSITLIGTAQRARIATAQRARIDAAQRTKLITQQIDEDLEASGATEGKTADQLHKIRQRAVRLAKQFCSNRKAKNTFHCDRCKFDPACIAVDTGIDARSLIDVHHIDPMAEGERENHV